ncbi:MAG: flagellar hook-associated protein FlgL [Burkholderiales bacterium]|nr:flagellar hook-associated protein FlgL [Burkholderiales bacterium]
MIRLSTKTVFEQGVFNLQRSQADVYRTQEQISTGRRIQNPSDDPVASARSLEVEQSREISKQYQRNNDSAQATLMASENAISNAVALLQDVRTVAVNAGNGALSPNELKSLASELRGRYQELLGIANTTDGNGLYLFSGYQGTTRPFAETTPGNVFYAGDQGSRLIRISASREIPSSDPGSDIFQRIMNGNGTFVTEASDDNTGSGVIGPGAVTSPLAWNDDANPRDFSVRFHRDETVMPPVTTYDIVDNSTGDSLLTGAPAAADGPYLRTYSDDGTISLRRQAPPDTNTADFNYGVEFSVKGNPATGDEFTIQASRNEDVFTTLHNLIVTLETASSGAAANARLANGINTALSNFDRDIDNLLRVQASMGVRLRETDDAYSNQEDLIAQYDETLSNLRDLDYAKALSDLARQQLTYEAAQKTFAQVQSLSLFQYI